MQDLKYNIGDLVEIIDATSISDLHEYSLPILGIYLGTLETTHFKSITEKEKVICYKIWALGKVQYISSLKELKVLSAIDNV